MTVYVVDDDTSLREALGQLLRSADLEPTLLASAEQFLAQQLPEEPSCLVLDVQLPDLSGLDLQAELGAAHIQIPIVFISGVSTVPMSVRAMKGGAFEFLTKPLQEDEFLRAVAEALDRDRHRLQEEHAISTWRDRYESLTKRERQVMELVAQGLLNKQIAGVYGISERTVKYHRGQVTHKMNIRSAAEFLRVAQRLGVFVPGQTGT